MTNFTKWVRGEESLTLLSPRPNPTKLDVIGLGGSAVGYIYQLLQDSGGRSHRSGQLVITLKNKDKVTGKIVCYDNKWVDYYKSVEYRVEGASRAAKYGAKAVLVRSVASASISSVHTGYMEYLP